jgi:hypothetical protein
MMGHTGCPKGSKNHRCTGHVARFVLCSPRAMIGLHKRLGMSGLLQYTNFIDAIGIKNLMKHLLCHMIEHTGYYDLEDMVGRQLLAPRPFIKHIVCAQMLLLLQQC